MFQKSWKIKIKAFLPLFLSSFHFYAQQNFFNVPSSDITEKNKVFLQQQVNLFPTNLSSNTTFCYGLGKNYEIGLNALGFTYDEPSKSFVKNDENEIPVFPSLGMNFQKEITTHKNYSLSLGGQVAFPKQIVNYEYYAYLNNKFTFKKVKWVGGIYYGNKNYFGSSPLFTSDIKQLGLQLGLELEVIDERLFLQIDFISGRTPMSNLISGAAFKVNNHFILSSGYQLANSPNNSSNGIIFEVTFL